MLTMRPVPAARIDGSTSWHHPRQAEDVGVELPPDPLERDVLDRAVLAVAGVVHQCPDPAVLGDDGVDGRRMDPRQ